MKTTYLLAIFSLLFFINCSDDFIDIQTIENENILEIEKIYKELLEAPTNTSTSKPQKKNPKKLYVHYMPWFHNKEVDGYWGQHWTMTNKNPDNILSDGKREIASHYYPLIGPYSSKDSHLQEYHLLLMKLSGIDGVIFDWYGSRDIHDYYTLKENTESFIKEIEEVDLGFAIMYEDRVAEYSSNSLVSTDSEVQTITNDFLYIQNTYFTSDNYLRTNGLERLFIFGPHYLTDASKWDTVFSELTSSPKLFTLWKTSNRVGQQSGGEFSWVDQNHLETLSNYYNYVRSNNINSIGGAYPGFNDFYYEGGWKLNDQSDWVIPNNKIQTFKETLELMDNEPVDFIQLITWNDFGEGTMLEPTLEFGFDYLEEIQSYTGVQFTADDLRLPYKLYLLRKKHKEDKRLNNILDGVYRFIFTLDLKKATRLLETIDKKYNTI